jgi:hypothetical protein
MGTRDRQVSKTLANMGSRAWEAFIHRHVILIHFDRFGEGERENMRRQDRNSRGAKPKVKGLPRETAAQSMAEVWERDYFKRRRFFKGPEHFI